MGDFGTFLPLAIGYVAVCSLNPASSLPMMGVSSIVVGFAVGLTARHLWADMAGRKGRGIV